MREYSLEAHFQNGPFRMEIFPIFQFATAWIRVLFSQVKNVSTASVLISRAILASSRGIVLTQSIDLSNFFLDHRMKLSG